MVVLLPKVNGEFQEIRLVEVLLKGLLGVINHQVGAAVNFHNILHGLRTCWGMVTASL